ncbi:MAG: hypothetical protein R3Y64_11045 [Peptostreptococcaceae bacterium]
MTREDLIKEIKKRNVTGFHTFRKNELELSLYLLNKGVDCRSIKLSIKAKRKGFDLTTYIDMGYDFLAIELIYSSIIEGLNFEIYIKENYTYENMKKAYILLSSGINLEESLMVKYIESELNVSQLNEIILGIKDNLDISIYEDKSFSCFEMKEIRLGLLSGVNILKEFTGEEYLTARPKIREVRRLMGYKRDKSLNINSIEYLLDNKHLYDNHQLRVLTDGIKDDLDISIYSDNRYDGFQMEEIRSSMIHNVDFTKYLNPKHHYKKMRELKLLAIKGLDIDFLIQYPYSEIASIKVLLNDGIEVEKYLGEGYSVNQLRKIQLGKSNSLLLNKEFEVRQMEQIRLGLQDDLDVSIYADTKYEYKQMKEIRLGLIDEVDVSIYLNSNISHKTMRIIRVKLKNNTFCKSQYFVFNSELNKFQPKSKYTY